jgi:hypothetical protein
MKFQYTIQYEIKLCPIQTHSKEILKDDNPASKFDEIFAKESDNLTNINELLFTPLDEHQPSANSKERQLTPELTYAFQQGLVAIEDNKVKANSECGEIFNILGYSRLAIIFAMAAKYPRRYNALLQAIYSKVDFYAVKKVLREQCVSDDHHR